MKYALSLVFAVVLLSTPIASVQAQTVSQVELQAQYTALLQQLIQLLTQQLVALEKQLALQVGSTSSTLVIVDSSSTASIATTTPVTSTQQVVIVPTPVIVPVPQPVEVTQQPVQQTQQQKHMSVPQTFTTCTMPSLDKGAQGCGSVVSYAVSDSVNQKLRNTMNAFPTLRWTGLFDYQLYNRITSITVTSDPNDDLTNNPGGLSSDTSVQYQLTPSLSDVIDAAIAANSGDGSFQQLQIKKVEFLQQMSEYGVQ